MSILSSRLALLLRSLSVAGALACASTACGQAIITTAAGGGFVNNAPAVQSHLGNPQGIAVDPSGNVYIADTGRILKIDHSTGTLTAVAGGGSAVISASDGPALSVRIFPTSLVVTAAGNVLFLDSSMLREFNAPQATITTLAGKDGTNGSTGDGGPASLALLNMPRQICLDAAGNIYISEQPGYVRRLDAASGVITTVAGNGGTTFRGDNGLAVAATLLQPYGIAADASGNIYIADAGELRIRKIAATTQIITTIAGTGRGPTAGDGGSALQASFTSLGALAADSNNNLYVVDGDRVRRIAAATGIIATVAGNGAAGVAGDSGEATQAELNAPAGLALDSGGDLFIADSANGRARMVAAATGVISTIGGTSQNGDGGLAAGAVLTSPAGVAVDSPGNLFIAGGNFIRKVTKSSGAISTFAGGGSSTQDGVSALQAKLNPLAIAFDSTGNLIVGEPGLIRRIDTAGIITTIAGTGNSGFSGDGGAATQAQVAYVNALALDTSNNVFFADAGNKRVRRIDASTGVITTVAGNGSATFSGLGQPAPQTGIGNVAGIAIDAGGNIYTGSLNTYFLLKISPAGAVSIVGGDGGCAYIGDGGPATITVSPAGLVSGASICQPSSVALDSSGNIFVGDTTCYCIRRIAADTGIIQTVAGSGSQGYTGDNGPAPQAKLRSVSSIVLSGTTLYIADGLAAVVRGVTPDTPPALPGAPTFYELVSSATFLAGAVSPGELVSFFGNYLGPAVPGGLTIGTDGKVTSQIPNENVQVFFDDVPSPLTYVAAGQINAIVPYSLSHGVHAVKVEAPGGTVSSSNVEVAGSEPGVFPGAIVNQDGSLNSASHPAPIGSYIVTYGTGLGQTSPAGVDGGVTPLTNYPGQVYTVALSISRNPLFGTPVPMKLLYGGPAPGLVAGVFQINAVIPEGVQGGENFVTIAAGPRAGPAVTLYVQ